MPRNSTTGVYTAPSNSWNPAVAGTVIDPDDWNSTLADMETGLSTDNQWVFTGASGGGTPAIKVESAVPWLQFSETTGAVADFDLIVDGGIFGIRVDAAFPGPFQIDANNQNRVTIQRANTTADDFALLFVNRTANHTGGTPGNVNAGINVRSTVSAGNTNYEWAVNAIMDNYATAGENVAVAATASKQSGAGPTWSVAAHTLDYNTDPASGVLGIETLLTANGTDTNGARIVVDIAGGKLGGVGTTPTITSGVRIYAQSSVNANATFTRGISFGAGTFGTLIGTEGSPTVTNGIDLSGITIGTSAFKSSGFNVSGSGNITAGDVQVGSANAFYWTSRSHVRSPADGYVTLYDAAETGFTLLQFGGGTASFPAWKRVSAGLSARLADDSADAVLTAASFIPSSSSAPTNGMFLSAANVVGIASNSTQKVWVNSSGLGVGAAPAVAFQATDAVTAQFRALTNGGGNVDFRLNAQDGAGGVAILGSYSNHPFSMFVNAAEVGRFTTAALSLASGKVYQINSVQVVGPRDTGWSAMTGTANEATVYDTATVTLPQLAGRVMALQAALTTHGLIGT